MTLLQMNCCDCIGDKGWTCIGETRWPAQPKKSTSKWWKTVKLASYSVDPSSPLFSPNYHSFALDYTETGGLFRIAIKLMMAMSPLREIPWVALLITHRPTDMVKHRSNRYPFQQKFIHLWFSFRLQRLHPSGRFDWDYFPDKRRLAEPFISGQYPSSKREERLLSYEVSFLLICTHWLQTLTILCYLLIK
jgi:hypothetical protein